MTNLLDVLLIFGFLTIFHLWGGAAIGAGVAGRRLLPVLCGALIGGAPLYFGIERVAKLGSWAGLAWQAACVLLAALLVAVALPRLRAMLLSQAMTAVMIGVLIMAAGALVGVLLAHWGAETVSFIIGGALFVFGAMWFGSGLQQARELRRGRTARDA